MVKRSGAFNCLTLHIADAIKEPQPSVCGGAVAQLGARLDGIEEVVGSNPIGSTNFGFSFQLLTTISKGH